MKNVIFLDYDGVVNTLIWYIDNKGEIKLNCNHPDNDRVNNWQAMQWLNKFCKTFDYSIVVSSVWRGRPDYKECLYKGGLDESIKILGKTPFKYNMPEGSTLHRGDEISQYLVDNLDITGYIILDDDSDMTCHMNRLVLCKTYVGFTLNEYYKAEDIHNLYNRGK